MYKITIIDKQVIKVDLIHKPDNKKHKTNNFQEFQSK